MVLICNFCDNRISIEQTHEAGAYCRLVASGAHIRKDYKIICNNCGNPVTKQKDKETGYILPEGIRKIKV